ncbi:MAG: hypothetical protein JSS20_18120 [Proteobacteria bacterium]|nr:hypothetical protein [Pseudomonadota bacterium]
MSGNCPAPNETRLDKIVLGIRDLFAGRSNRTGRFTMTINAASTTVAAPNCGKDSVITLTPVTANAATEYGAGTWYISAKAAGSFTVTHVNSSTASRTFDYAIQS